MRSITDDELGWFAALSPSAAHGIEAQIRTLWDEGSGRPDWTLIAADRDRPIGRLAMFSEPLGCELPEVECHLAALWLDLGHSERDAAAAELLNRAAELASAVAPTIIERRLNPEVHDQIPMWRSILEANAFHIFQEKEGFVWTDTGQAIPERARLRFRTFNEVGPDAFGDAMAVAIEATLDRNDRYYLERCGPRGWGRQMVEFLKSGDERSWLLGYEADGALVGYVAIGPFEPDTATVAHIGVAPNHRGRGYVDELLAAGTAAARSRGFRSILSDVDTLNAPMIAAMERNGHVRGVRPWHVWAYRRKVGEPVATEASV